MVFFTASVIPIEFCYEAKCYAQCIEWGADYGGICLEDDTCGCYANV